VETGLGSAERFWKPLRPKREGAGPMAGTMSLAQAQSNRAPQGLKKDFPDAERLGTRLVARELALSFVPDAEQRLWRRVVRRKYQLTRTRVQLQNRLESLLEEARIKLSNFVSDLLGASARRKLKALAEGGPPILHLWPLWRLVARVPRRSSCVTLSVRAWISTPSTGDG
jgi:transposase